MKLIKNGKQGMYERGSELMYEMMNFCGEFFMKSVSRGRNVVQWQRQSEHVG